MHLASLMVAATGTLALVTPQFGLEDGFPDPNAIELQQVENAAHGNLSNIPLPSSINADTLTSFKLIAFNEFFEVAFFSQLISNITNKVSGFESFNLTKLGDLKAIQAQEELHALTANSILTNYNISIIQPCAQYQFPGVTDLHSAFSLAATFTDLTLGLVADIQSRVASTLGASNPSAAASIIASLASVAGNEAQQDGYFRSVYLNEQPSAQPFLTPVARDFFLTAIQPFYVPGSCPSLGDLQAVLPTFQPLTVLDESGLASGNVTLGVSMPEGVDSGFTVDPAGQRVVLMNGASEPLVVGFQVQVVDGGDEVNVTAPFMGVQHAFYGLTVAAIVNGTGPFGTVQDVADATVFGPALIEFV